MREARPAPREARRANSRRRSMPRASCRLATLAQAMRRTKPTAPNMAPADARAALGMTRSASGRTEPRQFSPFLGSSLATRSEMERTWAAAWWNRDSRLQARHGVQTAPAAFALGRFEGERDPEVGFSVEEMEVLGHDADDRVVAAVETDFAAEDARARRDTFPARARRTARRRGRRIRVLRWVRRRGRAPA